MDLNNFITKKASSFDKESIFKVSKAIGPLAIWVKAIIQFS